MPSGERFSCALAETPSHNPVRYFNRDVECIRTFFRRRFQYESSIYPRFRSTLGQGGEEDFQLDVVVAASGFSRRDQKVLEEVIRVSFGVALNILLMSDTPST